MRNILLMSVMSSLLVKPLLVQSALPAHTVPLYLNDKGHAYIMASIDGVTSQPMIIDSAAQQSVLPLSLLPALQISAEQLDTTTVTSATGTSELTEGIVETTAVAGLVQKKLEYIFTDMSGLTLPSGEPGLLGHDFLSNYCVDMNFAAKTLTLTSGACDSAVLKTLQMVAIETSTSFIRTQARFADSNIDVLFDTGAHHSFINTKLAQQISDLHVAGEEQTTGLIGNAQPRKVLHGLRYQLGNTEVTEPKSYQADLHVFDQLGYQNKPFMLLGLRPFRDGRLVLDYSNNKLYFRQ